MESLKNLRIRMAPWIDEDYRFQYGDVSITLEDAGLAEGDRVADLWKMVAGVPGCQFDDRGLTAEDKNGTLPLTSGTEKDPTGFEKTVWRAKRKTEGDLTISYRFLPRDVSGIDRCHPLFDCIQEENGALICGVTALAAVEPGRYHIFFSWDKSHMPADADAAAIRGSGDFDFVGTPEDYTFSLYIAGKYRCAQDETGRYRVYYLDPLLPDETEEKIREQIPPLLKAMCRFFRDEDMRYSIFFRKEPFTISNSGTAFDGGFAFGYSDSMPLIMEEALNTLAHEIVHNWCRLETVSGEENWYSEGTAEFYSVEIPLRAGLVDAKQAAGWITEKCVNYYNNPHQNLSGLEAFQRAWESNEIQRVPYGRGFVYLAHVDDLLKQTGRGLSLDDLVLEIERRRRAGEAYGTAVWEELIERELGEEAVEEFRQVMAGQKLIEPSDQWFDGRFTFSHGTFSDVKRGTAENALIWRER